MIDGLPPDRAWAQSVLPWLVGAAALAVVAGAAAWGWTSADAMGKGAAPAAAGIPAAATAKADPVGVEVRAAAPSTATPGWPLWEFRLRQPIPVREPSLTPPRWRLIGAAQSGGQWRLIVQTEGKTEPQFLQVGDPLPGGHRIVAITEEDVTLQRGREQLVLSYIGY